MGAWENGAKGWDWHVILEYSDEGTSLAIDPAYAGTPGVRPIGEYLHDMFLRELPEMEYTRKYNGRIRVRTIPAMTYLEKYKQVGPASELMDQYYFIDDPNIAREYPSRSLSEFVEDSRKPALELRFLPIYH